MRSTSGTRTFLPREERRHAGGRKFAWPMLRIGRVSCKRPATWRASGKRPHRHGDRIRDLRSNDAGQLRGRPRGTVSDRHGARPGGTRGANATRKRLWPARKAREAGLSPPVATSPDHPFRKAAEPSGRGVTILCHAVFATSRPATVPARTSSVPARRAERSSLAS